MSELVKAFQGLATNAMSASMPAEVCFGTVVSEAPIAVAVDQKMTVGAAQLVLARALTDHLVDLEVEWETEGASEGEAHTHEIRKEKQVKVMGALKNGQRVLLLRMQGGQKYVVVDRLGGDDAAEG